MKSFKNIYSQSNYISFEPLLKPSVDKKQNALILGSSDGDKKPENCIFLGKIIESTSSLNLFQTNVWLDVTFPHVIYITGTRGSGKSFDLGVLIEGISELNKKTAIQGEFDRISSILIDTQSQFWTLQYEPNSKIQENRSQISELAKWAIEPNSLKNCQIFIPPNSQKVLGTEIHLQLKPKDISFEDWCALIDEDIYGPQGHILSEALNSLGGQNFAIGDLQNILRDDSRWPNVNLAARNALIYKISDLDQTNLFVPNGLDIFSFLKKGVCSILMLRDLRNEDKSIITSIIARQLFLKLGEYHKQNKISKFFGRSSASDPRLPQKVWLLIDEAHVIAPSSSAKSAKKSLIEYVKRGRDAGLSLVLATQQPSAVDDQILSQVNLSFNHRLTFANDINAAVARIPTKTIGKIRIKSIEISRFDDMVRLLDAGECFLGDHCASRNLLVKIRPRVTSHGGYSPI